MIKIIVTKLNKKTWQAFIIIKLKGDRGFIFNILKMYLKFCSEGWRTFSKIQEDSKELEE